MIMKDNTFLFIVIIIVGGIYLMIKTVEYIYGAVIIKMGEAIKEYEGYYEGSRSYRNNNPGNLKYIGQAGTTGKDSEGFAIFDSFDSGWNALLKQVERAFTGLSSIYYPSMTLYQFFGKYSPDGNSNNYAEFVAGKFGISANTRLIDLKA